MGAWAMNRTAVRLLVIVIALTAGVCLLVWYAARSTERAAHPRAAGDQQPDSTHPAGTQPDSATSGAGAVTSGCR